MYPPRPREELVVNIAGGCFVAIMVLLTIHFALHPEALRPTTPRPTSSSTVQRCTP